MLSDSCKWTEGTLSDGRFKVKPVIAGFVYTFGHEPTVEFCEALRSGTWVSCVQRE
jgi:hypothetical protein